MPAPAPYADALRRALIPELLRAEDVATILGVSAQRARERISSGSLGPHLRFGRRLYIRKASFLAAIQAAEIAPPPGESPRPPVPEPRADILALLRGRRGQ